MGYVLSCIEGKDSINHISILIGISTSTLLTWIRNYQLFGVDDLSTTTGNYKYSSELKEMAARDFLEEKAHSGTGGVSIMTKQERPILMKE